MNARRATCWAVASLLAITARVATVEETHVSSADDLCPSSANPCIISIPVTVDPPGDLDFGVRDVVIANEGRLRAERASVLCGSFRVEGPTERTGVVIADTDSYGSLIVAARRGCSLSPSTPCLDDGARAASEQGSCSVGEGTIVIGTAIDVGGCATLALHSCRIGKKVVCRG